MVTSSLGPYQTFWARMIDLQTCPFTLINALTNTFQYLGFILFRVLFRNQISGTIPSLGRNLKKVLLDSYVGVNYVQSILDAFLVDVSNLFTTIRNIFYGTLPMSIGNQTPLLEKLLVRFNQLTGSIPASIASLKNLEILDVSNNKFVS